jgi:hypothetical protein
MDAWFLLVMFGQVVGIPLLILMVALTVQRKSRWFTVPVFLVAIVGATLITVTDKYFPYPRWMLFWGAFTFITVLVGGVSIVVAAVVGATNASARKEVDAA